MPRARARDSRVSRRGSGPRGSRGSFDLPANKRHNHYIARFIVTDYSRTLRVAREGFEATKPHPAIASRRRTRWMRAGSPVFLSRSRTPFQAILPARVGWSLLGWKRTGSRHASFRSVSSRTLRSAAPDRWFRDRHVDPASLSTVRSPTHDFRNASSFFADDAGGSGFDIAGYAALIANRPQLPNPLSAHPRRRRCSRGPSLAYRPSLAASDA